MYMYYVHLDVDLHEVPHCIILIRSSCFADLKIVRLRESFSAQR